MSKIINLSIEDFEKLVTERIKNSEEQRRSEQKERDSRHQKYLTIAGFILPLLAASATYVLTTYSHVSNTTAINNAAKKLESKFEQQVTSMKTDVSKELANNQELQKELIRNILENAEKMATANILTQQASELLEKSEKSFENIQIQTSKAKQTLAEFNQASQNLLKDITASDVAEILKPSLWEFYTEQLQSAKWRELAREVESFAPHCEYLIKVSPAGENLFSGKEYEQELIWSGYYKPIFSNNKRLVFRSTFINSTAVYAVDRHNTNKLNLLIEDAKFARIATYKSRPIWHNKTIVLSRCFEV